MSYDAWKTTDPADRYLGRARGGPCPFRCLACGATGRGYMFKSAHFYATGHQFIVAKGDPRFYNPIPVSRPLDTREG